MVIIDPQGWATYSPPRSKCLIDDNYIVFRFLSITNKIVCKAVY